MSVLIVFKVKGDTEVFRKALIDRADEIAPIADRSRSMGAIHHRFGIGEDYVLVVDEWDTVEHFQEFFGDPAMQEFIGTVGADTSVPPEFIITEAIDSPDQF